MCTLCGWANAFSIAGRATPSRRAFVAGAAAAAAAAAASAAGVAAMPGAKADVVFKNGAVYTVDQRRPWVKAVAVTGKHIVYVGDNAGTASFVGRKTEVIDLRGRMLLPGFVEGHIHPFTGAAMAQGVDLQYDTREEMLKVLTDYAKTVANANLVRGFGWRYSAFPPTGPRKEDLDAIWPDRPVFLVAIDLHGGWVNSKALEIAGVTKDTPDPMPGFSYFERDPRTGEATGYLVEVPVMVNVLEKSEPLTFDVVAAGLARWLPQAAAAGITAVQDAGVIVVPEDEAFAHYVALENQGKLPFRVVGAHYYNNPKVDPVPIVEALRKNYNTELVRASVLKLNIDGGDAQYTAAMLAPYSDKPDTSGDLLLPVELLNRIVLQADRAGIDVHCHSYGDRATRVTLDAIEAAIAANPPRDRRHTIAHNILVNAADVARYGKLGVVAQFSAQWTVSDRNWTDIMQVRWGPRAYQLGSMASIVRAGGRLTFGTDWPAAATISTYKPLEAIQVAQTRRQWLQPDAPPVPPADESVDLARALRANTLDAAYQLRLDHLAGSIETGKRADLVVLEQNLFEVATPDIYKTKIAMTMMNGRFTYGG